MDKILLQQIGEDYIDRVVSKQKSRGIIASGRSAQSLRIVSDDVSVKVFGSFTFIFQEYGSAPAKNTQRAIFAIRPGVRKWIDDKPVVPAGISKDSLGWLISRTIAEKGTRLWRKLNAGESNDAQPVGLEEAAKEVFMVYRPQLQKQLLVSFRSDIIKDLKLSL